MPINIGTSPTIATGDDSSTVATSSFSTVSGSLLVAMVMALSDSVPTLTGGSLTWTRRVQQIRYDSFYNEIWTAPVVTGAATTVTVGNLTGSDRLAAVKVDLVTGQGISPIGNFGSGESTTNNATVNAYTSSAAGSRGFCASADLMGLGSPASTDDESAWSINTGFFTFSGMAIRKAADTPSSGATVTFNLDAAGTDAPDWGWAALEILPAVEARPVRSTAVGQAVSRAAVI
ncbi:hypothetical protein ACFYY8_31670 [Streptosporangium sp. NPDC001559]|uniref:hypothetical protein n=1 Tax=Streptosporangium sp. NPDC001559 TaxID=3366187 RepID=UPI0036F18E88